MRAAQTRLRNALFPVLRLSIVTAVLLVPVCLLELLFGGLQTTRLWAWCNLTLTALAVALTIEYLQLAGALWRFVIGAYAMLLFVALTALTMYIEDPHWHKGTYTDELRWVLGYLVAGGLIGVICFRSGSRRARTSNGA